MNRVEQECALELWFLNSKTRFWEPFVPEPAPFGARDGRERAFNTEPSFPHPSMAHDESHLHGREASFASITESALSPPRVGATCAQLGRPGARDEEDREEAADNRREATFPSANAPLAPAAPPLRSQASRCCAPAACARCPRTPSGRSTSASGS